VKASATACRCCGRARGFVYAGPVYGEEELRDLLCPWCIATGDAAARLGATFADGYALAQAGISKDIVREVTERTPGFTTWQSEEWLSHCGDACAFLGDATPEQLGTWEAREQLCAALGIAASDWEQFVRSYRPGGDPAVYAFECLVCKEKRFGSDCS